MTRRGHRLTKGRSLRQTCSSHVHRLHRRPPVVAADTPLTSPLSTSLEGRVSQLRLLSQLQRSTTLTPRRHLHWHPQTLQNRGPPFLQVPVQPQTATTTGRFPQCDPCFPRCRL